MLWANYHIALAVNCQESEYVEVILFLGCEASFDPEHPDGLDSALNDATFHVGIFDNEDEPIQCPITNGIFPEEGDTHGANLEPQEVGQIILQFQND